MLEDDIEYESFTAISIDSLLVYENKYYPQAYLDSCAYKIAKKTNDRLSWWKSFWRWDTINVITIKLM